MSGISTAALLRDQIDLLVRHFGFERVRATLAKLSTQGDEGSRAPMRKTVPRGQTPVRITVAAAIESIRDSDPEKHRLLSEFLGRLMGRQILPESQDIRHFAQLVGIKEISGRSRKEMVPKLMRFLLEQPVERLQADLQSAANISEQQRRMGFSVLTDKLLGE
ncbi:MAG: hypothetical protein ABSH00_03220 [Bryobacteraceae bacterium]|jgi:hypothetical protein